MNSPKPAALKIGFYIAIFLMVIIMTPVTYYFSFGARGFLIYIFISFLIMNYDNSWPVFTSIINKGINQNRVIFFSYLWFLFGYFISYLRGGDDYLLFFLLFQEMLALLLGLCLMKSKQIRNIATISLLFVFTIHCFFGFQYYSIFATAKDAYKENMNSALGTSGLWGAIAIMIPIFLSDMFIEKKLIIKLLCGSMILTCIFGVLLSGFASPIALLLIGIAVIGILRILLVRKKISHIIISFMTAMVLILASYFTLNYVLESQSDRFHDVKVRLQNFVNDPMTGGYTLKTSRFLMAEISYNGFKEYPFFGGGGDLRSQDYTITGAHSSILDYLAIMGLFGGGGAFLILIFKMFYNVTRTLLHEKSFDSICHFTSMLLFFIGGVMNPYWYGAPTLCIFMFGKIFVKDRGDNV